ncbi:MAG: hypothetical protein ACYC4R_16105 [Anaerolineae bacterium]
MTGSSSGDEHAVTLLRPKWDGVAQLVLWLRMGGLLLGCLVASDSLVIVGNLISLVPTIAIYKFKRWGVYVTAVLLLLDLVFGLAGLLAYPVYGNAEASLSGVVGTLAISFFLWMIIKPRWHSMEPASRQGRESM